jgi:hypothetical protein
VTTAFADRQLGVRRVLQRFNVIATSAGFLVLVGDGRVESVTKPAFRPLLVTRQCTQKLGIE